MFTDRESLRIIYYHSISEHHHLYQNPASSIKPKTFRNQLQYLKKYYDVISLDDAVNKSKQGIPFDNNLVITFDDGFKDLYRYAYPILIEEKLTCCTFLISSCVDNRSLMWRNMLIFIKNTIDESSINKTILKMCKRFNISVNIKDKSLLEWSSNWDMKMKEQYSNYLWEELVEIPIRNFIEEHKPYLSLDQIKEARAHGFLFGNHTQTHPICNQLDLVDLVSEIAGCKRDLERMLKDDIIHFAYPFGIRPNLDVEKSLVKLNSNLFQSICGTRNRLMNYSNPFNWERDRLEVEPKIMQFVRFYLMPFIRKHNVLR